MDTVFSPTIKELSLINCTGEKFLEFISVFLTTCPALPCPGLSILRKNVSRLQLSVIVCIVKHVWQHSPQHYPTLFSLLSS